MTLLDLEVKGQGQKGLYLKELVHPITSESFDPQSSYLAWRLVMTIR
jgi:hypothetical protein